MPLLRSRWIPGLLLAVVAGLGIWLAGRPWAGSRNLVVWSAEPGDWPGLGPDARRGLVILLVSHLTPQVPGSLVELPPGAPVPPRSVLLRFRGARDGDRLVLAGSLRQNEEERPFQIQDTPAEALGAVLDRLSLPRPTPGSLVPAQAAQAWTLIDLMGLTAERDLDAKIRQGEALVRAVPGCASAHAALADLVRLRLNANSNADPRDQEQCLASFERALAIFPHHPRWVQQAAYFLTDAGNQREALDRLFAALAVHPRSGGLWEALAYPARTGGLLVGARSALEVRDRLLGHAAIEGAFADNSYLYAGDLDRFEASLGEDPGALPNFYHGYCRLLRGDRAGARSRFEAACRDPGRSLLFERLAHLFLLGLDGRIAEARAELDAFRNQRRRLRVPDGEFTFKLAEAYAFLGETDEAMLLAERAFDQGFCCTPWFERSPLLAPVRNHPRWKSLIQHVAERQQLLESRFPEQRFRP